MKPQLFFIVLFFSFCNQIENLSYEIKSINNLENVDTKLSIGIENKLNSKTELTFQFFPKNPVPPVINILSNFITLFFYIKQF